MIFVQSNTVKPPPGYVALPIMETCNDQHSFLEFPGLRRFRPGASCPCWWLPRMPATKRRLERAVALEWDW